MSTQLDLSVERMGHEVAVSSVWDDVAALFFWQKK